MQRKYILLLGLAIAGCKESADYARDVQKENLRQFDSINRSVEEANARVLRADSPEDHLRRAKQQYDSLSQLQQTKAEQNAADK